MGIKQRSWRWRNRKPSCDVCGLANMRRERTEVDWAAQRIKLIWRCLSCGNHMYVYAQKSDDQRKVA